MKYVVGQKYWFEPRSFIRKARYLEVTKVGRKYAYLSDKSIQVQVEKGSTWATGTITGHIWESKEALEYAKARQGAWLNLKNSFSWQPHEEVSLEDILAAARLLRIDL